MQVSSVIQTKRFPRSDHSNVPMVVAAKINTPPMVGVPDLGRWLEGPSSRMVSLILRSFSLRMTTGPITKLITSAVKMPQMARNVR